MVLSNSPQAFARPFERITKLCCLALTIPASLKDLNRHSYESLSPTNIVANQVYIGHKLDFHVPVAAEGGDEAAEPEGGGSPDLSRPLHFLSEGARARLAQALDKGKELLAWPPNVSEHAHPNVGGSHSTVGIAGACPHSDLRC